MSTKLVHCLVCQCETTSALSVCKQCQKKLFISTCPNCKNQVEKTYLNYYKVGPLCSYCKRKQTNFEKFGGPSAMSSPEHKEKQKQVFLDKYGVTHNSKVPEVLEKRKQTNFKKFGGPAPSSSTIVQEKMKATCLKKYGVENYAQTKEYHLNKSSKYTFEETTFDSSWELAFWVWHKDHNIPIKRNFEKFEYYIQNKKHYFFPDFNVDGKLYEIKGDFLLNHQKAFLKKKLDLGKIHNITFLFKKEIQPYLDYCKNKYGIAYLKSFRHNQ